MLEPCGFRTYHKAAAIFRLACAKAITLATIDTLIAATAKLGLDRDFWISSRLFPPLLVPYGSVNGGYTMGP
jgi:hypothetical protein